MSDSEQRVCTETEHFIQPNHVCQCGDVFSPSSKHLDRIHALQEMLDTEVESRRQLERALSETKAELEAVIGSCTEAEMQAAYAKERLAELRAIGERIVAKVEKKRSEGMAVFAPEPLFEELREALRTEAGE